MTNSIEQMKRHLLDNERKVFNQYIEGSVDIKMILSETGLPRYAWYKAIEEIEPEATKIRKNNIEEKERKEVEKICTYIKQGIPFEYMKYDKKALFRASSKYVTEEANEIIIKNRVYNIIKKRVKDLDHAFIKFDNLLSMVKRIYAINELEEGKSGFSVSKKYGIFTSNIYRMQKQFHETKKYLIDVNEVTANVILRNIDIYNKSLEGIENELIAKEYEIDKDMVNVIIEVMKDIFDNLLYD